MREEGAGAGEGGGTVTFREQVDELYPPTTRTPRLGARTPRSLLA